MAKRTPAPNLPAAPETAYARAPARKNADLIRAGELTPGAVTNPFLARIDALDPHLHAFRSTDFDGARKQSRAVGASSPHEGARNKIRPWRI